MPHDCHAFFPSLWLCGALFCCCCCCCYFLFLFFFLTDRKEWKIEKLFCESNKLDVHPQQAPLSHRVSSWPFPPGMKVLDARRQLVVLLRGRKCRFWSQFNLNIFPAKAPPRVVRKELSTCSYFEKGCGKTVHATIPKGVVGGFEFAALHSGAPRARYERPSVAPYLRKCGNLPNREILVIT